MFSEHAKVFSEHANVFSEYGTVFFSLRTSEKTFSTVNIKITGCGNHPSECNKCHLKLIMKLTLKKMIGVQSCKHFGCQRSQPTILGFRHPSGALEDGVGGNFL